MSLEDDCLRFNVVAYHRACERTKTAPIELTESDFDQLAIVSSRLEWEAREALRQAQLDLVKVHTQQPAIEAKALPMAAPSMKEFLQKSGHRPATYGALAQVSDTFTKPIRDLQRRVKTLEAEKQALADRVLELEAQRAASHVSVD